MKYCTYCGKEISDNAYICPHCGCKVRGALDNSYSTMSVIGFVLAFFIPLAGLIVSILSYSAAKKENSPKSATLSKAGIIISAIEIALYIIAVVICTVVMVLMFTSGMYY